MISLDFIFPDSALFFSYCCEFISFVNSLQWLNYLVYLVPSSLLKTSTAVIYVLCLSCQFTGFYLCHTFPPNFWIRFLPSGNLGCWCSRFCASITSSDKLCSRLRWCDSICTALSWRRVHLAIWEPSTYRLDPVDSNMETVTVIERIK